MRIIRDTPPWIWAAVLASVLILGLLIAGLVISQSGSNQYAQRQPTTQVQPQPQPSTPSGTGAGPSVQPTPVQPKPQPKPKPAQAPQPQVISDRGKIEQLVPNKSMDVYLEQPQNVATSSPGNVVLVPSGSGSPGSDYRKTKLPAWFRQDGTLYIVEPGAPVQMDKEALEQTGNQVGNYMTYRMRGDESQTPTLYMKIKSNPDYYVPYDPPSGT